MGTSTTSCAVPDTATATLAELADRLHAAGTDPLTIALQLLQADARPDGSTPSVADLVGRAIGDPDWSALDAWQARLTSDPPGLAAGIFGGDDGPSMPTPVDVRRRKRGERWARVIVTYAEWFAPALMRVLRQSIVQLIRATIASELPDALDVLRPVQRPWGK